MPKKGDRHRAPRQDTMKCVRGKNGIIQRLANEDAAAEVEHYGAVYVPKKDWKAQEQKKAA